MGDKAPRQGRDARRRAAARARLDRAAWPRRRRRSSVAEDAGYPVLLKAAAGGGGRGMRLVDAARRARATPSATAAARGRGGVRRRRACTSRRPSSTAHHVEVQVLCDGHGGVLDLRRARVLGAAPPPEADRGGALAVPRRRRRATRCSSAAEQAVPRASSYRNAGTIEFLVGADRAFYFMEMNTRLQVEHPVTEAVTRPRPRARAAARRRRRAAAARRARARCAGTRIEFRLNAEDPSRGFMPSPGPADALPPAARARACASTRTSSRATACRPPTTRSWPSWSSGTPTAPPRWRAPRRALGELEIEGIRTTRELFLRHRRRAPVPQRRVHHRLPAGAAARLPPAEPERMSSRPTRGPSRRQARRAALMLLYQRST